MPPPSLSMTTIRTGVETSRRAARPPRSWSRPRSPVTIVVGRPLAWAAPMPEEIRPSMPLAPRLQRKSASVSAAAQERLLVADRHARGGVDEVAVAVGGSPRARCRAGSEIGAGARRARPRARPARPARRRASVSGAPRGPSPAAPPSPTPARSGRRAGSPRRGCSARSSRRRGRPRFRWRRSPPARPAAACWSASRRSAGRGRGRPSGRSARRAAAGRRRRRRGSGRGGPQRSCEVGSARIGKPETRARWASGSRSSGSSWRPATMTPAIASPMCPATSSSRKAEGSRSIRVTAVSGRPSRPSSASGSVAVTAPSTGTGASGSRQGEVEVDRAGPRLAARRRQRPAGDRAVVEQPVVVGRVGADFAEPADRGAEELDLVDRLPGADPAQLRRPVGAQHDQR